MTAKSRSSSASLGSAWALLAVSSDGQADTLPHQSQWAQDAAKAQGWRITRTFQAVASGKLGVRSIVREMMLELRSLEPKDRPAVVLMIRLDRLGRGETVEAQIIVRDLSQLGVRIFTRDQGEVRVSTAMEQLIVAVQSAVAAQENEVRQDKAKAVYVRKRAAGAIIGNKRAYGLRLDGNRDVPDDERADVVREAFRMRLAGNGYHRIGAYLHGAAPAQVFKNGRETQVRWTPTRVMRLLENRAYVEGGLVDEVTFLRVQKLRVGASPNRAQQRYPWPLSGALSCYCGRRLTGLSGGHPDKRIRYYACRASWAHETSVRMVRADDLEEQFIALLSRLRISPQLIEKYRRRSIAELTPRVAERNVRELRMKLAAIAKKRAATWDLHESGKVRAEDVQERLDTLAEQRKEFETMLEASEKQISVALSLQQKNTDVDALMHRAAIIFRKGTVEEQRRIAVVVAAELGGLCVEADGKLKVRAVEDSGRQRKRHASGN